MTKNKKRLKLYIIFGLLLFLNSAYISLAQFVINFILVNESDGEYKNNLRRNNLKLQQR